MLAGSANPGEVLLVETARHLQAGGASSDAASAVAALDQAAVLAGERGALGDAVRQLRQATEALGDPDGDTELGAALAVRLAWALRRSGERTESLDLARRALSMRGTDRKAAVLADAALLAAPLRPDADAAPAIRSGLARLGEASADVVRRASLLVELGWSLAETDPTEADHCVADGSQLADGCGAYAAAARALDFEWERHGLALAPTEHLDRAWRLASMAADTGDRVAATHGHLHRLIAYLELGQRRQVQVELDRVSQLAGEIRTPILLARAAQARSMWAHLNGDLEGADAAAHEVFQYVPGDPSFVPVYAGQIVAIRKETGQLEGMVELIDSDEVNRDHPLARAAIAMAPADWGRDALATEALEGILGGGLDLLPEDMSWLATVSMLAETSSLLQDRAAADAVWPLLLPYADRFVIFGYGAVCWGVVDRFLAPLAALRGDVVDAKRRFARSIERHRNMGAVPYIARDLFGMAQLIEPEDPQGARELFVEAYGLAERHGLLSIAWEAGDRIGAA